MSKTEGVLYIYDRLINIGTFTKDEIKTTLGISDLTFHRYLGDLRHYFNENGKSREIIYEKDKGIYVFVEHIRSGN
jgi:hypothetical protein